MQGQCLCGAVRFSGELMERGIGACHCGQCRRWGGGGPFMAVRFKDGVTVDQGEALTWFASSKDGERGFCNRCGTSLFWRAPGEETDWAINVSSLPEDHGQEIFEHIWVDDQPGWYAFSDDKPRKTAAQCLGLEE
ncbi:GFA family protein [Rhodobacteraceae bacterium NNCM2]|nr:GFA family protein [Coraliihabitans acroporae]